MTTLLSDDFRNGRVSYRVDSMSRPPARSTLAGPLEVDVAIVGAGLTGLPTA